MKAGGKMVLVLIISTPSAMIGIGKPIHHTEIRGRTTGNLLEPVKAIYYHITTQFWVLTGNAYYEN